MKGNELSITENDDESRPIVFRVRDLPIEAFGNAHGRQTRKFVLLTLATHADTDGTRCYPGVGAIARETGLSQRSARRVISWLREHGFVGIAYKASGLQTNVFTVQIPEVRTSSCPQDIQVSSGQESTGVRTSSCPEGEDIQVSGGEDIQVSSNLPLPTNHLPKPPTKAKRLEFVLPSWIPVQEWNDFLEMRKRLRKPPTDRAKELLVRELDKLRNAGDAPGDVLNVSIANSWAGLFPLKRGTHAGKKPSTAMHSGFDQLDYSAGLKTGVPEGACNF